MTIKETIAKNLKKFRKEKNISQKELGELIGVKNNSISTWESGINAIDTETLCKICKILKVSLNDMVGIKEEETEKKIQKELNKLNEKGKAEAEKRIKELTYIPEYTEEFLKENNIS